MSDLKVTFANKTANQVGYERMLRLFSDLRGTNDEDSFTRVVQRYMNDTTQ